MEAGQIIAADTSEHIFANEALITRTGLDQPWYLPFAQV
jgi:hypothetical protein